MKILILSVFILTSCGLVKSRHKKLGGDSLLILGKAARINGKKKRQKLISNLHVRKEVWKLAGFILIT
jgi:hypothetical protein